MDNPNQPIDQLVQDSRVRAASSVFPAGTTANAVTKEAAERVIEGVLKYIAQTGMARKAIAKALGVGPTTIGYVLNWKYPGNWQQVVLDLDRWLSDQEKRDAAPRVSNFVWTRTAEEIKAVADAAITLRTIGLVFGPSGIGKTMALQAIADEKAGAILITAEKLCSNPRGLICAIGAQLRGGEATAPALYQRIKQTLSGTPRLLIVDQVHNLCGAAGDKPLYALADIFDATGAPQLWCGTTDIVAYLDRGQAKGEEPLAQIRRRIGICRDLMERTTSGGDDGGEPLFSVEEVRKVFAKSQMRLSPDAARYLAQLANLPDSGGLGVCRNLVVMASKIQGSQGGQGELTADLLRAVHRLLANRRSFTRLEQQMMAETASPAEKRIPA